MAVGRVVYRLDFFDADTNTNTLIMIPILNNTDTDTFTTKCQHIYSVQKKI